ncbi:MAG: hypothetical protein PHV74_07845 [Dehalococcoidia bacterium]|nr:hypothetical protein [Dehalococcoidia bacterium]
MTQPGIHLTLLMGPTVPVPVTPTLLEALDSVEVTHRDQGRSGFQMTFKVGRSGPTDMLEFNALQNLALRPFSRVILMVTFGAVPRILMDGIITQQQLSPQNQPGSSRLVITGEDVSVMMDMEEKAVEHPAQNEMIIANMIIASYAQYGLTPMVIPPASFDTPIPTERTPVQQLTDLAYLNEMAGRCGYVFYVTPGLVPGQNIAYWGPPIRAGLPQKALSLNMGPNTNVEQMSFSNDALRPTLQSGSIQDRQSNQSLPVQTFASTRTPLSSQPALMANQPNVRRRGFRRSGVNTVQAYAQAQGVTDISTDDVVTASGELNALFYGDLLQPRGLVGVRGAGYSYDGTYYVKNVTHSIRKNEYKQRFTLTREGTGSITPMVRT